MNNGSKERTGIAGIGLSGPERTKNERSKSDEQTPDGDLSSVQVPDPEVSEKTVKRKFSVDYKAQIVREADACTEVGQIGALLRREGLYSSQLAQWRRAYQRGALAGLRDNKRGRKQIKHPLEVENERLKRANIQLEKRLEQAKAIIDIQKKLSGLLGIPLESEKNEGKDL